MEESNSTKIQRVLEIYAMLSEGKIVNKSAEAVMYGVNERSIQRDVNDIRDFLELRAGKTGTVNSIVYDRAKKGYRMETIFCSQLSAPEVLVIHEQVDAVKRDKEVGVQYMKSWEREMLIREEGKEEGREEGREEGIQCLNKLIIKLTEDGRADDIVKAAQDEVYQKQLLEEYGLADK